MRSIRRYLRFLASDWLAVVSGSASVPATFVAIFGHGTIVKQTFRTFAVGCLIACTFRVWLKGQPNFMRERQEAARAAFEPLDMMAKIGLRYILVRGEVNEEQIQTYLVEQHFTLPPNLYRYLSTDMNFLSRTFVGMWSINPIHREILEELFSEVPS
jgi:hypothetical protein